RDASCQGRRAGGRPSDLAILGAMREVRRDLRRDLRGLRPRDMIDEQQTNIRRERDPLLIQWSDRCPAVAIALTRSRWPRPARYCPRCTRRSILWCDWW